MKLQAISAGFIGGRRAPEVTEDKLRAARVEVARKHWQEIDPPERLVSRQLGLLVDEETDRVFRLCRASVFARGSSNLISGDGANLWFYVNRAGWPVILEPLAGKTWSGIVERRARKSARR